MQVKHFLKLDFWVDFPKFFLEVVELIVKGDIFNDQWESAEQFLIQTNPILIDELEKDLNADSTEH